ncbi:MAG: septal ring lytic transglycosylase RlpA family protein [Alphaproteobacteria bacterium]|nr:septal ring lytic transglycosylase RlpA family protein [Alphaproteobacteria bacterium]
MPPYRFLKAVTPLTLCIALAACGTSRTPTGGGGGGYYKVGQPYQINNRWYYPKEDYNYDESGIASWYGADFHEQMTANGEIYNKDELTAAHKTLPLPSLARVTNLENGKSIVVRINDRGPFSGARIIDVSQRAANLLGFENAGTAKVRVQVLADESKAIADAMRRYGTPLETPETPPVQLASAETSATPSLVAAPVETQTLKPMRSTEETRRQLIQTKPLPYAVQLPVTGKTQIYVQAGAFSVPENAQRLQQKLSKYGAASVSTALVNGMKFYRVRLGPIADVPQADALLSKMKTAGISGARTVVD